MWANTPNLLQIKTQTNVFRDRSGKQFLKEFWSRCVIASKVKGQTLLKKNIKRKMQIAI